MNAYPLGNLIQLTCTFTDPNNNNQPVDPTTVTCTVRDPRNNQTTPPATRITTGVYRATIDAETAGVWNYRFTSTGAYQAANETQFQIINSNFQ